jgi:subtilisin family serine protease
VFHSFTPGDTVRTFENGRQVEVPDFSQTFVLEFPSGADVPQLVDRFAARSDVLYAEPNHKYSFDVERPKQDSAKPFPIKSQSSSFPNDPRFGDQWSLEKSDDEDIHATAAWSEQRGNYGRKIGIMDSGIDYNNRDLGNGFGLGEKVVGGYDFHDDDSDPMDTYFHGTHVAGITGALTNNLDSGGNREGIAGIAGGDGYDATTGSGEQGAQLFAFRVGAGPGIDADAAAEAIVEAADPDGDDWGYGIDVLNNSWGGTQYNETVRSALNYAALFNRIFVAAKGNANSTELHYPSDYDDGWVISVGATDKSGDRATSEDPGWGSDRGSNYGNGLDLIAPGTAILSTMPTTRTSAMRNRGWPTDYAGTESFSDGAPISGTSFAAPHVSGTAALLLSEADDRDLSFHAEDVEGLIRASAEQTGPDNTPGYDNEFGDGRLNAARALDRFSSPWSFDRATATGGSSVSSTDTYTLILYDQGAGDLASGSYIGKRYTVERSVSLPDSYSETPDVWCRGSNASTGWSAANPNYQSGYCRVTSSDYTSVQLRTYVYEIWDTNGRYLGWYPSKPGDVTFAYSISGKSGKPPLELSLSGPTSLDYGEQGTWTADVDHAGGDVTYKWYVDGSLVRDVTTSSMTDSYSRTGYDDFNLQVDVSSSGETDSASRYVYVSSSDCPPREPCAKSQTQYARSSLPDTLTLHAPAPNPVSAATTLQVDVPEPQSVTVTIYDVMGRQMARPVDGSLRPGVHHVQVDVSGLSSGVYVVRIRAGSFTATRRITVVR